jgi:hypothetical protein
MFRLDLPDMLGSWHNSKAGVCGERERVRQNAVVGFYPDRYSNTAAVASFLIYLERTLPT